MSSTTTKFSVSFSICCLLRHQVNPIQAFNQIKRMPIFDTIIIYQQKKRGMHLINVLRERAFSV